ncbi:hypothetical protein IWQ61_005386 [Dispira simplex]|nr:hypothetical protein IWQ61_005386 [Dispira simplex]
MLWHPAGLLVVAIHLAGILTNPVIFANNLCRTNEKELSTLTSGGLLNQWFQLVQKRQGDANGNRGRAEDPVKHFENQLYFAKLDIFLPFITPYYKQYSLIKPLIMVSLYVSEDEHDDGDDYLESSLVKNYEHIPNFSQRYPLHWAVANHRDHGLTILVFSALAKRISDQVETEFGHASDTLMLFAVVRDLMRIAIVTNNVDAVAGFYDHFRHWAIKSSETVLYDYYLTHSKGPLVDYINQKKVSSHPFFASMIKDVAVAIADSYTLLLYLWVNELSTCFPIRDFLVTKVNMVYPVYLDTLKSKLNPQTDQRLLTALENITDTVPKTFTESQLPLTHTMWARLAQLNDVISFDLKDPRRVRIPVC